MNNTKLKSNAHCGYTASKIYRNCCENYGFLKNKSGAFAKEKSLFAAEVTPEGYDVIFLAHSNRTHSRRGHVTNTIAGDNSWVTEKWDDDPAMFGDVPPTNDRLVFAKDHSRNDAYIFIGHFRFVSHDADTHTSVFELFRDCYPASPSDPVFGLAPGQGKIAAASRLHTGKAENKTKGKNLETLFPSYAGDLAHPGLLKDLCPEIADPEHPVFISSFCTEPADFEKAISKGYYHGKIDTAIHEAGHIVAGLLVSDASQIDLKSAEISWGFEKDAEGQIHQGWSGFVRVNALDGHILETVVENAGVAALQAIGSNGWSFSGATSDMEKQLNNRRKNTKYLTEIDRTKCWTQQKNAYRELMDQETAILFAFTKQIMEDNKGPIITYASALYDKLTLSHEEIYEIAKSIHLNAQTYRKLQGYIKAFYS